jgi:hypothetical protein
VMNKVPALQQEIERILQQEHSQEGGASST